MSDDEPKNPVEPDRRNVLQAAGAVLVAGMAASGAAPASAQTAGNTSAVSRNSGSLGARLQGVQHFGVTVQNMDRAFAFYTEVLGGTEVMRDGDFHGEVIHNTLLTDQEIEARKRRVNPRTIGVPDLRGGAQRLDVRFIQFDNVVIELLQYRDAAQPIGSGDSFAEPHDHMSPAYPRSMHICFHVRDDVDFNQFIRDLEAESARRGMTQVRANRTITVTSDQEQAGGADVDQYQPDHRQEIRWLVADLLQGTGRRTTRIRAGIGTGEENVRGRAQCAPPHVGRELTEHECEAASSRPRG